MKVLGIISEYNPFHLGHKYHIEASKSQTGCNYVIALMSGSVVQRGEFAIMEPHRRAAIALQNGIDLVLELPSCYSSQSAEIFAKGSIHILHNLGIVDAICCGSETITNSLLNQIIPLMIKEPEEYKKAIGTYLGNGNSFPKARALAIKDLTNIDISSSPNDTLAIEYKKSLTKKQSSIIFSTIQRLGQDYNSKNISQGFSSATGIREAFKKNNINQIKNALPENSLKELMHYGNIIDTYPYLKFLIQRDFQKLQNIFDIEEGLEHKIKKELKTINIDQKSNTTKINIDSGKERLIEKVKSKRYTYTRISRILNNILLDITKEDMKYVISSEEKPYAKILGFNKKGQELLKKINQESITLINKSSTFKGKNKLQETLWHYDSKVADIYLSLSKENYHSHKQISPLKITSLD